MTHAQFVLATMRTRTLLERDLGHRVEAERQPLLAIERPHLAWMLEQSAVYYREGRTEKANRWLGYVQGVIAARCWASLDELKRANMPEGETFDAGRV